MARTHTSWAYMQPNKNEKYEHFKFEEYYKRMLTNEKINHIPKTIFEQWIYYQHQEPNTLNNYAWLNYENIEFELCEWGLPEFDNVNVIENFKDYYSDRASYSDFKQFGCIQEDLNYWQEKGTWRVPPIIIDTNSIRKEIPPWSDLKPPYQLVEGIRDSVT